MLKFLRSKGEMRRKFRGVVVNYGFGVVVIICKLVVLHVGGAKN